MSSILDHLHGRLALRLAQWIGGFSLSTTFLFLIAFLTTIILRRKGYGVRLGLASVIFYARPGSRRFPDGCQVRVTSRIVGFLFGGCRGPWLDVSAERFYMRLRPTLHQISQSHPPPSRRWMHLLHLYSAGIAAVDHGYWSTLFRNIITRIVAFIVRGLRVRVQKVRIWKDGGVWEYKAEQLILAGRAVGIFGSRYSLSVNELYVNFCQTPNPRFDHHAPLNASLVLRRGVEINAFLTPRFFTLLRPRRMAILDDLTFSVALTDISCTADHILDASVSQAKLELCPGYSRSLRAKLPPSAPATKRPRKPGFMRYWEGSSSISGLTLRFQAPIPSSNPPSSISTIYLPTSVSHTRPETHRSSPGSENGVFLRLDSIKVDAYGKAADERHEAMTHASVHLSGCSAGSIAVDALSHALYEAVPSGPNGTHERTDAGTVEVVDNIDKIVAARPEALLWIEDLTAGVDVNCSKRHSMRIDVGGSGGVMAIEPVGLVSLVQDIRTFITMYIPPRARRSKSNSSIGSDSLSSIGRTASSTSLRSQDIEQENTRLVCDLRAWTFIVLGHGPVGNGDTMAIVASSEKIIAPQIDFVGTSSMRLVGSLKNFTLMHWSQWTRTTNVKCEEVEFAVNRCAREKKKITFQGLTVNWDLDVQSGLESLPGIFAVLKDIRGPHMPISSSVFSTEEVPSLPQPASRNEWEVIQLSEAERRERREKKHEKILQSLGKWEMGGSDITISASFPDGPKLAASFGRIPLFSLNATSYSALHVTLTMQDKKVMYGAELRMDSPLHTMNRIVEARKIAIEVQGLRVILPYDFQFGFLLQDWLLRLRAVLAISREARLRRRGIPVQKTKKKPLPDIYFESSDIEIYFEDHPIGGFLTRMLPLMQDESQQRLIREDQMDSCIQQLQKIEVARIVGTSQRCIDALKEKDSEIWVDRVQKLKTATPALSVAKGYLPDLEVPPVATFVMASLSFSITMDDLARQHGSAESIRRMRKLDEYELGPKKYHKTRQYDTDAWNSIGFRNVSFEAVGVRIRFRDYNVAFLVIDRMRFENTTFGQAVQTTLEPYVAETTVAIGRRRKAKVVKGLGPTKTFADIHLKIDTLQCGYNPSFFGAIGDFSRGVSRFFSGGKNPSPRIPWFDTLRVNMHGRMRLTANKFKGHLTSSTSPYSMTKHYAEIEADNFEMLASRLNATERDPFPVAWTLHNWHIRPYSFDEKRKSEILFKYVRVGLNPQPTTLSGDSQDHYFVPFASKEQVIAGGPGVGKAEYSLSFVDDPVHPEDNGLGNYTNWTTGLHRIPGYDSYSHYKTHSMILGIDICIRHAKVDRSWIFDPVNRMPGEYSLPNSSPPGASVLYSDAFSTMSKVVKKLVKRPISCRMAPRRVNKKRKPPSRTGLSSTLRGLDVTVDASNLNVMFYNNLEPGHGLFISIASLTGELWKRTDISRLENDALKRTSRLTRRRFNMVDIHSSIQVPGLDMAVDSYDMGKLLTVDKISLSDDLQDELPYMASPSRRGTNGQAASGFGSNDLSESPFYTFSATHPFQRGKKLDKLVYDKRLLVDRVRLIWSPVRRTSIAAWPDAFKEKSFVMKAPKAFCGQQGADVSPAPNDSDLTQEYLLSRQIPSIQQLQVENYDSANKEEEPEDFHDMPELDLLERAMPTPNEEWGEEDSRGQSDVLGQKYASGFVSGEMRKSEVLGSESVGNQDPISIHSFSNSRSKITAGRQPVAGSMVDLLSPYEKTRSSESSMNGNDSNLEHAVGVAEVLKRNAKFAFAINDCQVVFGSPETTGIVFLTSRAVSVGIVDKKLRKRMQFGETNERWSDREFRVHLNAANLLTRSKALGEFDFSLKTWVTDEDAKNGVMGLVTTKPICLDLMYISSSSTPKDDSEEEEDDHILRPSLLFINTPDITLSTNADEFHAVTDVVRKVLMQSMRSSELVNEELASLRYKLQLAGGEVKAEDLDDFMRRLNNVTRQFLYAGDTFQEHLVESLMLPDEKNFADTLLRYKAKAKAVATFVRQDQRASSTDTMYPTMYVSYSFDKCSWELREKSNETTRDSEDAFVEISLEDLVCRHIFYVGRGSSTEMTFGHISARNNMNSYLPSFRQPVTSGTKTTEDGSNRKSRIKASDGAAVAFRWFSTQEHRVGGIPIYELLTIQVAPITAAVTRKLYSSVSEFIFSTRSRPVVEEGIVSGKHGHGAHVSRMNSKASVSQAHSSNGDESRLSVSLDARHGGRANDSPKASAVLNVQRANIGDDVSTMAKRGETSMLFKYVFIDALELTASYKNKENAAKSVLDFFDLFVSTPSFSYSSEVWTWKAFSSQIRRDLVMTFARRSVSNLAKIKLLPGYNQARRRLMRGADSMKESLYSRFPTSSGTSTDITSTGDEEEYEALEVPDALESSSEVEEEDVGAAIDEAVDAISSEDGLRREKIVKALYGSKLAGTDGGKYNFHGRGSRSASGNGSESSAESNGMRGHKRSVRPPIHPNDRSKNNSVASHGSVDGDYDPLVHGHRGSLFSRFRRKAPHLKEEVRGAEDGRR